ncbi:hypothetical protein VIGAN_07244800 [Vigna angularis var. angularis]|uniref:Uncharacterized protein n=1 Tax=Vigna angularis var. angularis TaxID=157739 RepID=A0A0S3SL40_PHAAN|nr:hypothetical protein VIGAN_07244800 [Vigna angularis var. angularis]
MFLGPIKYLLKQFDTHRRAERHPIETARNPDAISASSCQPHPNSRFSLKERLQKESPPPPLARAKRAFVDWVCDYLVLSGIICARRLQGDPTASFDPAPCQPPRLSGRPRVIRCAVR